MFVLLFAIYRGPESIAPNKTAFLMTSSTEALRIPAIRPLQGQKICNRHRDHAQEPLRTTPNLGTGQLRPRSLGGHRCRPGPRGGLQAFAGAPAAPREQDAGRADSGRGFPFLFVRVPNDHINMRILQITKHDL